jgi:hypothetical protein
MPYTTRKKHPDNRYKHYYDWSIDHGSSPHRRSLVKKLSRLYGQIVALGDTFRYSTEGKFVLG